MIRLYLFPASLKGTPNPSPFCLKLEAALRLAGVPHQVWYETDPRNGPKSKLPFIEIEGSRIGDSALVLDHLKETLGVDLDQGLSAAERAQSHMLQRMLDERLYWVLVQSRWIEEANWPTIKKLFFGGLPFPLSLIVPRMASAAIRSRRFMGWADGTSTRWRQCSATSLSSSATARRLPTWPCSPRSSISWAPRLKAR